jgi:hypothetical protein
MSSMFCNFIMYYFFVRWAVLTEMISSLWIHVIQIFCFVTREKINNAVWEITVPRKSWIDLIQGNFLKETPLLELLMSYISGLGPFWWNSYPQNGDFFNENLIQSKEFTIHLVTKSCEVCTSVHNWAGWSMILNPACSAMGKMSAVMDTLIFSPPRMCELLVYAVSLMQSPRYMWWW